VAPAPNLEIESGVGKVQIIGSPARCFQRVSDFLTPKPATSFVSESLPIRDHDTLVTW